MWLLWALFALMAWLYFRWLAERFGHVRLGPFLTLEIGRWQFQFVVGIAPEKPDPSSR